MLDRILGELGGVYERVNMERRRVEEIADAAMLANVLTECAALARVGKSGSITVGGIKASVKVTP